MPRKNMIVLEFQVRVTVGDIETYKPHISRYFQHFRTLFGVSSLYLRVIGILIKPTDVM